ncbi:MAG TPA: Calx-beta domain-containing protein [Pyrinomonadaceae bacterium]
MPQPTERKMPRAVPPGFRAAAAACLALALLSALALLLPAAATPAASAQGGQSLFVRKIALRANDVVYSSATNMLYASVPSAVGAGGNTVTPVDPATGAVGAPVFVGSEPKRLAVSDDGNTLYAALDGAAAIRRLDLQTMTAGSQFYVGLGYGPYGVNDMAVAPGEPGTVAVVRYNLGLSPTEAGVAIFDNGVQRPQTGPGHTEGADFVAYSDTPQTLYGGGYYYGLRTMTVGATGITSVTRTAFDVSARIKYSGGRVYSSSGQVVNPASPGTLSGTFSGVNTTAFVPDAAVAGRAYYLTTGSSSNTLTLKVYDVHTYVLVGSQDITGVSGSPVGLVRWGANGLAFNTSAGDLYVIQTSLIPSASPVPTPTPTPAPATPTPTPDASTFIRRATVAAANDIVYIAATDSLYGCVPSAAGAGGGGNSIVPVNPTTGAAGAPVFIGSEPNRLALADDGRTLYAYLDGARAVRRFDLLTQTPGLQFAVGSQIPADIEVMPGHPETLAVSPGVNFSTGVTLYDNGVARPRYGSGSFYAVLPIEFASDSVLYGYDSYSSGFELVKFNVDSTGVTTSSVTNRLISGYSTDIEYAGGLIYSTSGSVVDPEAKKPVGTFAGASGVFAVDVGLRRAFFLSGDGSTKVLRAYDIDTFLPVGSATIQLPGTATRLLRWGANGLAVRVTNSFSSTTVDSGVYLIQSALVSPSEPVPVGVYLANERPTAFESSTQLSVVVARTGGLSQTTTVSYATADGTATAGSDYTAASGTLTFSPGETSKSVTIQIRQDNVYEGTESFSLTLGTPSGGAVLSGPSSVTVTLSDDEFRPSISIANVRVNEGQSGQTDAQLLVTLSNASVETVAVNYATADGTAAAGSDYTAASGTLTFPPLTTSALVTVKVSGDFQIEPDETFTATLSAPSNGSLSRSQATGTIANDDGAGRFQFGAATYRLSEDGGGVLVTVNRVGGVTGAVSVNYAASGGTATAGPDYAPVSGTLAFAEGEESKSFTVAVTNDTNDEPDETVQLSLSAPSAGAVLGSPSVAVLTIANDDRPLFQFDTLFYAAGEASGKVVLGVTRTGDPSGPASVSYSTSDGTAGEVSDSNLTLGTLHFAAGETRKSVTVLVTNDAFAEPAETFLVTLSAPSGGALGTPAVATVTLDSDDASNGPNPVGGGFDAEFFVRQHYADFLNREPDAPGLQFWKSEIDRCGADAACAEVKRVHVSAAFFLSIEFQETGYFVYRLHQAAYDTREALRWRTFLADTQEIGRGVQVGVGDWKAQLEANKRAFVERFAASPAFAAHLRLSNASFVDELLAHTFDPLAPGAGPALTEAERSALIADLNQSRKTRAEVLSAVAENAEFSRRQSNRAFVLMQYYGYLRRNPNDPPDGNFDGYNFWLSKLNQFGGHFINAEMVKAFINSDEYRKRFGQ